MSMLQWCRALLSFKLDNTTKHHEWTLPSSCSRCLAATLDCTIWLTAFIPLVTRNQRHQFLNLFAISHVRSHLQSVSCNGLPDTDGILVKGVYLSKTIQGPADCIKQSVREKHRLLLSDSITGICKLPACNYSTFTCHCVSMQAVCLVQLQSCAALPL